ncbi:ester cyclase [Streptomyces bobili]|uniref:ester cyclase n=1 Tax=Streptomyces bobili TaxID=67280 RepID=UPI0037F8063E
MRRYTRPALVVTTLGALSLAAFGTGAAADTADANTGSGSPSRATAESVSWNHKRVMERYTSEYLPGRNPALASEFVSPDIVVHSGGQTWQGRDTYLGIVAANLRAFPDLKWTVQDMRAEGDTVAVRYTMTGTHEGPFAGVEATGRAIRSESMAFYRLSHGKIVEERAQLDMLGILRQMGAVPAA